MSKKFAVFDVDGTLIRWQLYHAVVHELAKQGVLGNSALERLNKSRLRWKKRQDSDGWKKYEHDTISAYETALKKITTGAFDQAVVRVLDEYKDQTYVYTRNLAKQLKSQGYFLIIISGSHHEMIEQLALYYGFDDWIGSRYLRKENSFSGEKLIASIEKDKSLQKFVRKHDLSYKGSIAIGDSASDIPMMELVEQPIAFNPDQTLLSAAQKNGWKVVVERKNVVYELIEIDGEYKLLNKA